LKQDERYASPRLEILKEHVEKIELCRNRKNLSPIEKLKALKQAHYRVYETGFLSVIQPLRYQSIETRHNLPHHLSCRIKDAVQKFANVRFKVFKEGFDARIDILNLPIWPAYAIVGQGIKKELKKFTILTRL
jgi:hypothetical protein